jgi:hypothetical protein
MKDNGCRYETFGLSDSEWNCDCDKCLLLNHGCRYSLCHCCGLIPGEQDSKCVCEWNCRCHECIDDRQKIEYERVDKADVLTGNQREIMIWGKNNIIVDMNMMLDSERKDHHNELAAICKHLTQSDAKLSESDKKHEIELADVRILATAEVDDLLKKKITQFNWKLGCSEENQEAWRVKIADKDNLIKNLEQKIKYQAESMHNLRDNLSEAKNQLVDKMAEQPVSKKSRI